MKNFFVIAITATAGIFGLGRFTYADAQQRGPEGRQSSPRERPQMSDEDRAAFLDARLASIRTGLRLSADQEKLWPALEVAARDRARIQLELQKKETEPGSPPNLIEGLRRHGEGDLARGAADMRLADAAQPLWASLSEEQRRRLPMLARGIINIGAHDHERGGGPRPQPDRREPRRDHQGFRPAGDEPAPPR